MIEYMIGKGMRGGYIERTKLVKVEIEWAGFERNGLDRGVYTILESGEKGKVELKELEGGGANGMYVDGELAGTTSDGAFKGDYLPRIVGYHLGRKKAQKK